MTSQTTTLPPPQRYTLRPNAGAGPTRAAVPTGNAADSPQTHPVTTTFHETGGPSDTTWTLSEYGDVVMSSTRLTQRIQRGETAAANLASALSSRVAHVGFRALFLPEGYPQSVSDDYAPYQVYDALQTLCSSITGTLSTRAILTGVGVGEAEATAIGGLAQWLFRDGVGMVGRIAFASVASADLDREAKRWRLAADFANDVGLVLEVVSSHLPAYLFLPVVSCATLIKSVTCVAGDATKASLTQHFALRQNLADVAAKGGSQATAVNLLGMILGMLVAAYVPETLGWTLLVCAAFSVLHLASNFLGERVLILDRLNETRLLICLEQMGQDAGNNPQCPTPLQMRELEPIVMPHARSAAIELGASLRACVACRAPTFALDCSKRGGIALHSMAEKLRQDRYLVVPRRDGSIGVALAEGAEADPELLLTAYLAALDAAATTLPPGPQRARCERLTAAAGASWPKLKERLLAAGWRMDRVQLRLHDYRVKLAAD